MKVEISVHGCGVRRYTSYRRVRALQRESYNTWDRSEDTPFSSMGFGWERVEGVAAAAIERTRVCDHRKGVKTPSWRRRWVEEHVAEERGV